MDLNDTQSHKLKGNKKDGCEERMKEGEAELSKLEIRGTCSKNMLPGLCLAAHVTPEQCTSTVSIDPCRL